MISDEVQECREIIAECKDRLKNESKPDHRKAIAELGITVNRRLMQLNGALKKKPLQPKKYCPGCKKDKNTRAFVVTKSYKPYPGKVKYYTYDLVLCGTCRDKKIKLI